MNRITPVSPQKQVEILDKAGFKIIRQKGSHIIMMNDRRVRIVVPMHPGKDVKPRLINIIIKEAGLMREEFLKPLRELR
ncbi:MAG: type II toxin-antitoxin system HicA family toxin [Candidatus Brockarchaeota archaeon]|nr:type II toxin-antitoxin system HicA family toxin [Candidatus Brockarchaeota archaeon]